MFVAPVKLGSSAAAPRVPLPQTATPAPVHTLAGLAALFLGLLVLALIGGWNRGRRNWGHRT